MSEPVMRTWVVILGAFKRVEEHHYIQARTEEEARDIFEDEGGKRRDPEKYVEDESYYECDGEIVRVEEVIEPPVDESMLQRVLDLSTAHVNEPRPRTVCRDDSSATESPLFPTPTDMETSLCSLPPC